MGLCKCPKKKVTNLFCFEHKVNVCEHCLVAEHEKCIVKSYLQWLEDSDYNSICGICEKQLQADDVECIRLICYDVFHLKCLNEMANQLPDTTAPAGYECPVCKKPIIPHRNQAGPLVESIRNKINKSQWFLRTLRLKSPADENDAENFEFIEKNQSEPEKKSMENVRNDIHLDNGSLQKEKHGEKAERKIVDPGEDKCSDNSFDTDTGDDIKAHSVYQMPDIDQSSNIRKTVSSNRMGGLPSTVVYSDIRRSDEENKYSRKSLVTHISTLIKAYFPLSTSRRSPQKAYRYFIMTLIIGILLFVILLWLFSILGRYSSDQDPMLDPRYNPNLAFVQDQQLVRPARDDKDGLIVRGAVNHIEAPSHGR